jgi:hypothetical protein
MQSGERTVTESEQFATEQQQPVAGQPLHVAAQHKAHQMMDAATASARRMTGSMRGSLDRVEERVEHQGEDLLRMARKQLHSLSAQRQSQASVWRRPSAQAS